MDLYPALSDEDNSEFEDEDNSEFEDDYVEVDTQDITPYGVDANFDLLDQNLREKTITTMVVIVLYYQHYWPDSYSGQDCMRNLFSHSNWLETFDALKVPGQTNEEFVMMILQSTDYFVFHEGVFNLSENGRVFAEDKFAGTIQELENAVEFTVQA